MEEHPGAQMDAERALLQPFNEASSLIVMSREHRFKWGKRTTHFLFFVTYLLDWGLITDFFYESSSLNSEREPSYVHYMIAIIALGSPVLFFQTFVGQYTRRGCIVLGEMLPVAYGLGFSMLLLSYLRFTFGLFYTVKILEYLLDAVLKTSSPWMSCSKKLSAVFPGCFQKEDIDKCPTRAVSPEPCFQPGTRQLSAFLYKEYKVFARQEPMTAQVYKDKLINHSFHLFILLPLLLIFTLKGIKSFAVSLRLSLTICLGVLITIFAIVFSTKGSELGVAEMFKRATLASFLDLHTWAVTFRRTAEGLRLAEGGNFLFGSFIPESDKDPKRYLILVTIILSMILLGLMYLSFFVGLLLHKINLTGKQLGLLTGENVIFVTEPTVLGIQAYFFTLVHFLLLFTLSLHALVLKVFVMEKTITVEFNIDEFSHHIEVTIILSATILSYVLEMVPYHKVIEVIECEARYLQSCVVGVQLIVLLMYGYQRMCDDAIFYLHSGVSKFTQLRWAVSIFLSIGSYWYELKRTPPKSLFIRAVVFASFGFPFIVFIVINVFSYIRQKNMIGLLRPSDFYGPPDVGLRILRILYNPRFAIKSKELEEICHHNCFQNGVALKVAIQDEIELIQKFIRDLEAHSLDIAFEDEIISELKIHKQTLLEAADEEEHPVSPAITQRKDPEGE